MSKKPRNSGIGAGARKPTLDAAGRFDDTLRRLIQVPKTEIDKEESKYAAMRKRLKDKKAKKRPAS
jgi:hypothetical protein